MQTLALTPPSGFEWVWVLLAFVLLFGAKKLPELGSSVGKSITNFKKGMQESRDAEDEPEQPPASLPPGGTTTPTATGAQAPKEPRTRA